MRDLYRLSNLVVKTLFCVLWHRISIKEKIFNYIKIRRLKSWKLKPLVLLLNKLPKGLSNKQAVLVVLDLIFQITVIIPLPTVVEEVVDTLVKIEEVEEVDIMIGNKVVTILMAEIQLLFHRLTQRNKDQPSAHMVRTRIGHEKIKVYYILKIVIFFYLLLVNYSLTMQFNY